jgi:hypothetical protein
VKRKLDERPGIIIKNKLLFSSDTMLHKNCYCKVQLKKSLVVGLKGLEAKMN